MAVYTADKRSSAIFVPPRIVVWGVPTAAALAEASATLFGDTERAPAFSLDLSVPVALPTLPNPETRAVLWFAGAPASAEVARSLLYDLVRPLLAQRSEFVVGFEQARDRVAPSFIGRDERWRLDVEDAVGLLEADAVTEHFAQLHLLRTRVAMTPIEEQLAAAFEREGVKAEPQVRFGAYTVDFLVRENGSQFAVEADGAGFHDPDRDSERDATLRGLGVTDVLRFTGSEIYRDADRCANRVKERLQGASRRALSPARQTLDESQTLAVQHAGGAARVLAPAGAGKTRVLVNRVAELIERGVEPSSILALAFNKKAQEQMTGALREELRIGVAQRKVYDRSDPGVRVLTFNAFGKRTLDERFGYAPTPTSEEPIRSAMERAVQDAGTNFARSPRGSDPLGRFLEARARVVADLRPVEAEHVELEQIDAPALVIPFEPVNQRFEAELIRRGVCGFDDQIGDAVTRLLADREQRVYVQNFFTHVLVDEFQDLNPSQLALLDIVARPHAQLFAVGDDDQLIYGWNYADLSNILDFEKRQPGASTHVLHTNYRCSSAVVHASRRVIENNTNRVAKPIEPGSGAADGTVAYSITSVLEERLDDLVAFVKASHQQTGEWRKAAVLCRYKSQQPLAAYALDRAGIPRSPLLHYRLFTTPVARLLRSYLTLLLSPEGIDGVSLASLLNKPNRYTTRQFEQEIKESHQPWQELLAEVERQSADSQNAYRWRSVREGLIERVASLRDDPGLKNATPAKVLERIVAAFELRRYWSDAGPDTKQAEEPDADSLLRLLQLHASDHATTAAFATYWDEQREAESKELGTEKDTLIREVDASEDRVVIGTIHSSKGREYDAVVLFDFDVSLDGLSHRELEEERRVFYVGMTRAKDRLLLTADSNRRTHPFILESILGARGADESNDLQTAKTTLATRRAAALIESSKTQDLLERYESGAEARRLNEELAPHVRRVQALAGELEAKQAWLESSGVIDSVLGRRRKTRAAINLLEKQHAAADATSQRIKDELRLLEIDPEHFTRPLVDTIEKAKWEVATIELDIAKVTDREGELKLLSRGAKPPPPGQPNLRIHMRSRSLH